MINGVIIGKRLSSVCSVFSAFPKNRALEFIQMLRSIKSPDDFFERFLNVIPRLEHLLAGES